jgi:hypothetical protein
MSKSNVSKVKMSKNAKKCLIYMTPPDKPQKGLGDNQHIIRLD